LYKNLAKKDDRLLTIWNILDDHSFAELQLMQKQLPVEMFLLQILQKNVQNMIHVFKRAVSPACEQFLLWFKQELTVNYRFRTIYLQVCKDGYQWLVTQWNMASSQETRLSIDEAINRIEMKFE